MKNIPVFNYCTVGIYARDFHMDDVIMYGNYAIVKHHNFEGYYYAVNGRMDAEGEAHYGYRYGAWCCNGFERLDEAMEWIDQNPVSEDHTVAVTLWGRAPEEREEVFE